jgi:hypothetical protein
VIASSRTAIAPSDGDSANLLEGLEAENAVLRNSVIALSLEIQDLRQRR